MKRITVLTILFSACMISVLGCKTATVAQPLAPGYSSPADQSVGQDLAALNGFVAQEKINYAALTPAQQASEKVVLNSLITATDAANIAYTGYHAGTQTLAQAQAAVNSAKTAQSNLTAVKEKL